MSKIFANKLKFKIQRNISEYYPIIVELKKDIFPFQKSNNKRKNIIFLQSGENEIILPGKITDYNFSTDTSNKIIEEKLEFTITAELNYEASFLYLSRWLFKKCKRLDCPSDLFKMRDRTSLNLKETTDNLMIIYLNHLLKPYAKYIRKNFTPYKMLTNIDDLFKATLNLGGICQSYNLINYEENKNVDIVIPTYGKFKMTLRCILSIYKDLLINRDFFENEFSIRIIVTEDQSKDLEGIEELRILSDLNLFDFFENNNNFGFLENCNNAVNLTRNNSYIVFLNNDVQVLPGWLMGLLETYKLGENIGLVGSKLIYPDNKLQEAGGIIWKNANAWNYGRLFDPDLPEFIYSRDVDYISGASIMIKKELFLELDSFDTLYKPAYYEDTDLAMKIHENNMRVVFQPQSQVIHLEGQSCGNDIETGTKSYQAKNQIKFFNKWINALENHFEDGLNISEALNKNSKGNILIIENLLLDPDGDAGSLYMVNICLAFKSLGYNVSYIPADNYYLMTDKSCNMGARGIEVIAHPRLKNIKDLKDFKGKIPVIYDRKFDLALVARPSNLEAIDILKETYPNIKIVYYTHDLHHLRTYITAQNEIDLIKKSQLFKLSKEFENREKQIFSKSDLVLHVSEEEEEVSQQLINHKSLVLPPVGQEIKPSQNTFKNRFQLLFLGNFNHIPNIDGMIWFIEKVFPIILLKNKNIYLNIVGGNINKLTEKINIDKQNIKKIGYVDDLNQIYNSIGIGIAPLREGAGVKGKVLSYLSAGLPVVATDFGAQGIVNKRRKCDSLKIKNKEEEFANAIISLTELNKKSFEKLSLEAQRFEKNNFGTTTTIKRLKSLLLKLNLNYRKGISDFKRYQKLSTDIRFNQENSFTVYSNEKARNLAERS